MTEGGAVELEFDSLLAAGGQDLFEAFLPERHLFGGHPEIGAGLAEDHLLRHAVDAGAILVDVRVPKLPVESRDHLRRVVRQRSILAFPPLERFVGDPKLLRLRLQLLGLDLKLFRLLLEPVFCLLQSLGTVDQAGRHGRDGAAEIVHFDGRPETRRRLYHPAAHRLRIVLEPAYRISDGTGRKGRQHHRQ